MADTRTVLQQGIELWNAHDRQRWVGLFDDDADLEAPGGIRVRGRSGAELFFDTWHEAFPDNSIADAVVFGAGEQGVEEAQFAGTHTGVLRTPNGDIPPTGRNVASRYAAVCHVRADKVTSFHMYFDVAEVLAQLGLMS